MPAKRQIREGDHPKWLSKIILEMELCNIQGSLQQFNKQIFAFSPKTQKSSESIFSEKEFYPLRGSLQQLSKWNFATSET